MLAGRLQVVDKALKKKWRFLQKYWHKGAFFQAGADDPFASDGVDEVFRRDFSAPTGEDKMDKSILPAVMQVCTVGLRRAAAFGVETLSGRSGNVTELRGCPCRSRVLVDAVGQSTRISSIKTLRISMMTWRRMRRSAANLRAGWLASSRYLSNHGRPKRDISCV